MKINSPDFRQMQRERIYKTKPWLKSTGPKTVKGKESSKMNALKTSPEFHILIKEMNCLMKQQEEIFNTVFVQMKKSIYPCCFRKK